MSWLGSLFTGSNPTLSGNINKFGQEGGFAENIGQEDTTVASKFYTDILSDNPTKMAEAVAPETAAAQEGAQQAKNQTAEFSPRSGGTAAAMAGLDADTRGKIIKLLGGLQTGAASGAASLGTNEQATALTAQEEADKAAQEQQQNQANSILGKMITSGTSDAMSSGLGAIGL